MPLSEKEELELLELEAEVGQSAPAATAPGNPLSPAPPAQPALSPNGAFDAAANAAQNFSAGQKQLQADVQGFKEYSDRQVSAGVQHNITFNLANAASKALGGPDLAKNLPQPEWGAGSLVGLVADPATFGIAKATHLVGASISKSLGITKTLERAARLGEISKSVAKLGLENAEAAHKRFVWDYARTRLADLSIKLPLDFGVLGASSEAAKQAASDDPFKPADVAKAGASGAALGLGAALLGGVGLAAQGAAKIGGLEKALAPIKAAEAQGTASGRVTLRLSEQTYSDRMSGAFDDAKATVLARVAGGKLHPEQAGPEIVNLFKKNLGNRGILKYTDNAAEQAFGETLRSSEKFSAADKLLGTKTGAVNASAIEADFAASHMEGQLMQRFVLPAKELRKTGMDEDRLQYVMQYIEADGRGGFRFDPSKIEEPGNIMRDAFQGQVPTQQQLGHLYALRANYEAPFEQVPWLRPELGHRRGYIPLMPKAQEPGVAKYGVVEPKGAAKIAEPGMSKRAEFAFFDPNKHEANFLVSAGAWSRQVSKLIAYRPVIRAYEDEILKLTALQQNGVAQELTKTLARSMKIKNEVDLRQMFYSDLLSQHNGTIDQIQKILPPGEREKFGQALGSLVREAAQNNWVHTNPGSWLRNLFEPELVMSAEVGGTWVAKARAVFLNPFSKTSRELRQLSKEALQHMRSANVSNFELPNQPGNYKGVLKVGDVGLNAVGRASGRQIYNRIDSVGRQTSWIAGYLQMKDAFQRGGEEAATAALDGLLHSQRELVRAAYAQGGSEAASRMYALQRALRAHYAYSLGETANWFAEGAGKAIPFSTWGSNQWNRFATDWAGRNDGSGAQLARRIFYPMIGLSMFTGLTGYKMSGANPVQAVAGSFTGEMLPQLGRVQEAVQKGGLGPAVGESLLSLTPFGQAYQTYKKHQKTDGDALQSVARLKKAKQTDPAYRALEAALEGLYK